MPRSDFVCPFLTLRPLLGADPLRPELAESTYALYRATRDPYYLRQGETMLQSLNGAPRVPGGFASVKDVKTDLRRTSNLPQRAFLSPASIW